MASYVSWINKILQIFYLALIFYHLYPSSPLAALSVRKMGPLVRFESLELQEQVQEEDEQNITEGTAVDIDDPRYRRSFCLV